MSDELKDSRAQLLGVLGTQTKNGILARYLAESKQAMDRDLVRRRQRAEAIASGWHPFEWMVNPLRVNMDYQMLQGKTFLFRVDT